MSGPESSAGGAEAREDACRDYQSSLEDLTFNSKPHINMLTILAEENVPFAKDIVSLIEAQIAKNLFPKSLLFTWLFVKCLKVTSGGSDIKMNLRFISFRKLIPPLLPPPHAHLQQQISYIN
uniref:CID domain-containing protein n=1 Tax=Chelonoidis abingdonii TaxID=106734 RepID=A0A8C0QRH6_CHEAB